MADQIATYERNRNLPGYQPASLSGQAAAVSATGERAALTARQGQADARQIAVIAEPLGKMGMQIGTDLAKERGMDREIEPMRDKEGNLVPRTVAYTLNLEQQVYNKRADAAWSMEALYDVRKQVDKIAQENSQNPDGYELAAQEALAAVLAKATGPVRDEVEPKARSYILQQRQYLATEQYRGQREGQKLKAQDSVELAKTNIGKVIARDGTINAPGEPNTLHPEIQTPSNEIFATAATLSATTGLPEPIIKDRLARDLTTTLFKGQIEHLGKVIEENNKLSKIEAEREFVDLGERIHSGEMKIPAWKNGWTETTELVSYQDVSEAQKVEIDQALDQAKRGQIQKIDFKQNWTQQTEFTKNHQKDRAVSELAWKPASKDQEAYVAMTERDAQAAGVHPILASSILGVESAGNPGAVSNQDARGLMQMLPGTAIGVAKNMAAKGMTGVPQGEAAVAALKDPRWAVALGTHYLGMIAEKVEREHPGLSELEYHAAIAFGYHQGEADTDAWFKAPQEVRDALLQSYQETTSRADWTSAEAKALDAKAMESMGQRPAGLDYVRKVASTYVARVSGEANHYRGRTRAIMEAYGDNREMLGPLLRDLTQDYQQQHSVRQFTQQMFQAPPIWDPRFADQWAQMRIAGPGPTESAQLYESFKGVSMTDLTDIQLQLQEASFKAAGGTMAGVRSRGGKITPLEEVRGNYDQGVAMQMQEVLVAATGENYISDPIGGIAAHMTNPQSGEIDPTMMPAAVAKFVNRYSMGDKTSTGNLQGMLPNEAVVLSKNLLNAVTGNQQIDPSVMQASQQVLRQLTHVFDPAAGHGAQGIAQQRMRNLAKVMASQMSTDEGKHPGVADVMTALKVVANNGDRLSEQRPAERAYDQEYVRALLNGEGGEKAYRKLSVADKQLIDERVTDQLPDIIDAAGSYMMQHGAPVKGMATPSDVPPMVKQAILAEATRILPMMSEDQMENLGIKAAENLVNRGELGWSRYGAQGIEPVLVAHPVETYLSDGQDMDPPVVTALYDFEGAPMVKVPRLDENGRSYWDEVPATLGNPVMFVDAWVKRARELGHDMRAMPADVVEGFRNGNLSLQTIGETVHPSGAVIPTVALKSRTTTDSGGSQGWTFVAAFPLDIPTLLGGKPLDTETLKKRGMGDLVDARGAWQTTQSAITAGTWFGIKRWFQGGSEFRRRAGISTLGEIQGDPRASAAREAYNFAQGPTMFQRAATGFMELFSSPGDKSLTRHPANEPTR